MFLVILGGFLMALADSVPGVSGGTIWVILANVLAYRILKSFLDKDKLFYYGIYFLIS